MSKYISWTNVFSVWAVAFLLISISWGNYSSTRRILLFAIIAFLVAHTVSDIISRYQSLKSKEEWKSDEWNGK